MRKSRKRDEAGLCAFCIDFVSLRARACVLRRRNEKKARQQEKHRLLYTIIIVITNADFFISIVIWLIKRSFFFFNTLERNFSNDLVFRNTKLLEIAISRNTNCIRRIELNHHQMAVVASPILCIIKAADMQTMRTMIVLVIIDTVASDFNSFANLVKNATILIYSTSDDNSINVAML